MGELDTQRGKYVTFMSNNEYFALKIEYVSEIIVLQEITAIPESEDYIKGLINLRGKIIPVVDVRLRFRQEPVEYNDRTCIIVIQIQSTVVGLIVEKIAEVVEIEEDNILPPPSFGQSDKSRDRYVSAIGKVGESIKMILDPDKLLNDDELTVLEQVSEEE
jgi:purine-binding chemotaxis protein CheW